MATNNPHAPGGAVGNTKPHGGNHNGHGNHQGGGGNGGGKNNGGGGKGSPTDPTTTTDPNELPPEQRDAYQAILKILQDAGLESLAPVILSYVQQSYNSDTIMLMIQDTPEYKTRFAANEERKKAGYPVLSIGEYIAAEQGIRQAMVDAGLPKGFYDSYTDFQNWIGGDVSPTEVQGRVQLAQDEIYSKGPEWRAQLRAYYPEIGDSDLVALALDRDRALPLLQKQWREADLGTSAKRSGLDLSLSRADELDAAGVTSQQADQGFQSVAQISDTYGRLGHIYGQDYTVDEATNEVFGLTGQTEAAKKRKKLASSERASFGGSSGLSSQTLGAKGS